MGDRVTYSADVPNYTGGELLHLEIGSRDGDVFIALSPGRVETRSNAHSTSRPRESSSRRYRKPSATQISSPGLSPPLAQPNACALSEWVARRAGRPRRRVVTGEAVPVPALYGLPGGRVWGIGGWCVGKSLPGAYPRF